MHSNLIELILSYSPGDILVIITINFGNFCSNVILGMNLSKQSLSITIVKILVQVSK